MFSRRIAALAVMVVMVLVAAGEPAMAGVGGCFGRIGVGGCAQLTAPEHGRGTTLVPATMDLLRGAVRADLIEAARALYEGKMGHRSQQPIVSPILGDAGCRPKPGVGGCWQ